MQAACVAVPNVTSEESSGCLRRLNGWSRLLRQLVEQVSYHPASIAARSCLEQSHAQHLSGAAANEWSLALKQPMVGHSSQVSCQSGATRSTGQPAAKLLKLTSCRRQGQLQAAGDSAHYRLDVHCWLTSALSPTSLRPLMWGTGLEQCPGQDLGRAPADWDHTLAHLLHSRTVRLAASLPLPPPRLCCSCCDDSCRQSDRLLTSWCPARRLGH